MPQKTRKEKLAAAKRRNFQYTIRESPAVSPSGQTAPSVAPHKPVAQTTHNKKIVVTDEDMQTKRYFLKDLGKSAVLISMIFALEFFLRFVRIDNYFFR